jgi:hypothetical protein
VSPHYHFLNIVTILSQNLCTMSNEPQSLRGLFLKAERAREELSSSYEANSPTYQENLGATIATYEECLKISEQVSLFSPNETLEDISSSDLQCVFRPTPRSRAHGPRLPI